MHDRHAQTLLTALGPSILGHAWVLFSRAHDSEPLNWSIDYLSHSFTNGLPAKAKVELRLVSCSPLRVWNCRPAKECADLFPKPSNLNAKICVLSLKCRFAQHDRISVS